MRLFYWDVRTLQNLPGWWPRRSSMRTAGGWRQPDSCRLPDPLLWPERRAESIWSCYMSHVWPTDLFVIILQTNLDLIMGHGSGPNSRLYCFWLLRNCALPLREVTVEVQGIKSNGENWSSRAQKTWRLVSKKIFITNLNTIISKFNLVQGSKTAPARRLGKHPSSFSTHHRGPLFFSLHASSLRSVSALMASLPSATTPTSCPLLPPFTTSGACSLDWARRRHRFWSSQGFI